MRETWAVSKQFAADMFSGVHLLEESLTNESINYEQCDPNVHW